MRSLSSVRMSDENSAEKEEKEIASETTVFH